MSEMTMDMEAAPNGAMILDTRDGKRLLVTIEGKNVRLKAGEDNINILLHADEAMALVKALTHYAGRLS